MTTTTRRANHDAGSHRRFTFGDANHTDRFSLIIGLVFVVTMRVAPKGIVGTIIEHWRAKGNDIGE